MSVNKEVQDVLRRMREQAECASGFENTEKQKRVIRKMFKDFDFSGNGQITFREFADAMRAKNFLNPPNVLQEVFEYFDNDGNEYLDIHEFTDRLYLTGDFRFENKTRTLPDKVGRVQTPALTCARFEDLERRMWNEMSTNEQKMWEYLDGNRNGYCTLGEIDKFVKGRYPELDHPKAIMRAFKRTCSKAGGGDGDDKVQRHEFKALMRNLVLYNQMFKIFEDVDTGDDMRINLDEFKRGLPLLNVAMTDPQAEQEFAKIKNGNLRGNMLFDEFCTWYIRRRGGLIQQ
jgi:Ca2+-binding EF-hand superfamily protein